MARPKKNLSSALSNALAQASEQLFREATEALTPHEREAFVEAAEFARNHRRGMVHDFMKHFETRYLRACQRKSSNLLGHFIDFDEKELKVVEHHVLDDSLEPGKITEAIQNSCWKTLQMLTSQFQDLLNDQELLPNDIPLGPKAIEAAVADAIRDQPWRHQAKQRLVHALRWPLAARVNLLYRDLVDHLSARDLKAFATTGTQTAAQSPSPAVVQQPADLNAVRKPAEVPVATAVVGAGQAPERAPAPTEEQLAEMDASAAAWDEVARCLEDPGLPRIVADFLSNHWRRLLAGIHARFGGNSTAWRDGVRTMDELAWSLAAKSTQEECLRLTEGMPYLLQRLNKGIDALNLPQETRNDLLAFLSRRHAEVMRDSMALTLRATPPAAPVQTSQPVSPPPVEQAPETWLAELKVGTWLAFREPDGATRELKLAWVSPQRSLFLLTNRQGQRALSLSAADLAKRIRAGEARRIQPPHSAPADDNAPLGHPIQKTA